MKRLLAAGTVWAALAASAALAAPPAPPPPPITGGVRAKPGFQYPYGDFYRQAPVRRYYRPNSVWPGGQALGDSSRRYPLGGPDNDSVGGGPAGGNPASPGAAAGRTPSGAASHRWFW